MRRHLQEQVNLYGEQNMVNMVNHKGHEKPIKDAYEKYFEQVRILISTGALLMLSVSLSQAPSGQGEI
jgi:hypothetical protein